MTDEEAYEMMRQSFLDYQENRDLMIEELAKHAEFPSFEEASEFLRQIETENEEFVLNDERINWKLLNLNESSEVFGQTQSEVQGCSDTEDDYISQREDIEKLAEEYSSALYADFDRPDKHFAVCPLCSNMLQFTNNVI
jgi:hypothetical protein